MELYMMNTYIAVDVETTGLLPKHDKIIEIGAVKIVEGKIKDTFCTFVKPGKIVKENITELTGITNEDLQNAPLIEDIVEDFLRFVEDLPLLGHSIMFDYAFLKRAIVNVGYQFEKEGLDTLKIARKYLPHLESRRLMDLCKYYGIPHNAHRALDDAIATHTLYQNLLKQFYEGEVFRVTQLSYKVKKEQPIMIYQKERLYELIKRHNLKVDYDVEMLTKSEASRFMDKILAKFGR